MKLRRALILAALFVGIFTAFPAQAVFTCPKMPEGATPQIIENKWISVAVPIPGVTTTCVDAAGVSRDYIQDVGAYIGGLYKFLSGAIGIIATVMVFWGGIRWVTAAGNPSGIKDAKEIIFSALIAVVISLGSYLLLYVINPNLVNLRPPTLVLVKPIEQRYANCSNVQHCQSGPKQGQACATSAECGGAPGSGICRFDVDVGTDLAPKCGKEYTYTGDSAGTDTCQGSVCFDTFGNISNDVCSLGEQDGDTFTPKPVGGTTWGCAKPQDRCEAATDDDASAGDCRNLSVAGVGRCAWLDVSIFQFGEPDDRCAWYPALSCGDGWVRAGCGECNDPNGDGDLTDLISCLNVGGITIKGENKGFIRSTEAKCTSSAAETVYVADPNADQQTLKGICCKKAGTTQLKCVSKADVNL